MTTKNKAAIDLASGEIHIDLLSDLPADIDVAESAASTVTDHSHGPMVVVSSDRLFSLELSVVADLAPGSDVVQLDTAGAIAGLIASCDELPSLFLVDASMVAEVERVLAELGLDTSVIAIVR